MVMCVRSRARPICFAIRCRGATAKPKSARGNEEMKKRRKEVERQRNGHEVADSTPYNYLTHYLRNAFDIEATELFSVGTVQRELPPK